MSQDGLTDQSSARSCLVSLVAPMYNEEDVCAVFFARVVPLLEALECDYEIVCVNDGSRDRTLGVLREFALANPRIKVVDLSRNFGKEIALTAGLDHASGVAVIPIDADLQDPPELIPEMLRLWRAGNDVVLAIRQDRSSDSVAKRWTSSLFYRTMGWIGDISLPPNAGDFRLMDRRVVDALMRMPERTRFMKGLFAWLGFREAAIYYSRPARAGGQTKWKPWHLWTLALDGIVSFSTVPLKIWTYLGFLVALLSCCYLVFILARTLWLGIDVPGYASLLSVILGFSGLNMIGLGILGEYIARIFVEVKQRPLYLVREYIGVTERRAPGR